jgi:predicted transcriptional regulator of viral defense system
MKSPIVQGNLSDVRPTQRERTIAFLRTHGMARLAELAREGVTAATVSRLEHEGTITKLGRGLYQLSDAQLDTHHSLAEASKRVPKGVVALVSALAYHGVTDQMPRRVWIAIGRKDWTPKVDYPPLRIVRYPDALLHDAVERHAIEGVSVPIFGVARSIIDAFRYRRSVGIDVAVQALKETLRQRKATPGEIAEAAARARVWPTLQPYLEALTADG